MKQSQFVIEVIKEKYGEYLEMAGENEPAMLLDIMACTLWREIQEKNYYKRQLDELRRVSNER
jgi:hypothetical protein